MFSQRGTILVTLVAIYCLIALPDVCDAARILGYFPTASKSHLIIHTAIAETLAERGHNVTVFSTLPPLKKNPKYKYVYVEVPTFDQKFVTDMVNKPLPMYRRFGSLSGQIFTHANATLTHPKTQQFIQDNKDSFDLMILGYFMNDYQLGLAAHFNCPVIISFMIQPIFSINHMLGNPSEISYVPNIFGGGKQPLNYLGRVKNFLGSMFEQHVLGTIMTMTMNKLYAENFPADRYPTLEQMYNNVSLVLVNHHSVSQGPIRPNVPALIEIGGIQVKEQPDPLPADISKILDDATEGVIYFSLGTNVQGTHLTVEKAKIMFDVLSRLPYTVLWKWGDSQVPGKAANIIYRSWLPQDDILAHPNVRLFITHGGQGSVVESQYHGVPMVAIPLFGDQPTNVANLVRSGFGLGVEYISLSEQSFTDAILEVLENKQYAEAVKQFSTLYRDRPMTARQNVIYWVEYVLRHRGAKHLQSPAVLLNWWQLHSLDVIALLALIVFGFIAALLGVCKLICCRGKKLAKTNSKSKKNKKE